MKRGWFLLVPVVLFACAIFAASRIHDPGPPTPLHVTDVFIDGINHADYRQACSAWGASSRFMHGSMYKCELGLTKQLGYAAIALGQYAGFHVVPHSVKQWRQNYRGHVVELATVKVKRGQYPMVAHLRKINGHWIIWYVV